jgi:hypothetical protein
MKNKTTMFLLALFIGAIIGAAICWMLCNCCCQSQCTSITDSPGDTTAIHQVSVTTANTYFRTYFNNPVSVDSLKAFSINNDQFTAMKLIAASDSTVHGFRIYMGMDSLTPVRIVVGTGSPDKTNMIYITNDLNSGPCPWACDSQSPISDL